MEEQTYYDAMIAIGELFLKVRQGSAREEHTREQIVSLEAALAKQISENASLLKMATAKQGMSSEEAGT
jgi:hypothetical protein